MAKKKTTTVLLGGTDFGPVVIRPVGAGWDVAFESIFHCSSAIDAARKTGELISMISAARGDWHVHVSFEREQRLGQATTEAEGVAAVTSNRGKD